MAALKAEHLDSAGGYLHVVNGKGGKQHTCIILRPALEALGAYLQGRGRGSPVACVSIERDRWALRLQARRKLFPHLTTS